MLLVWGVNMASVFTKTRQVGQITPSHLMPKFWHTAHKEIYYQDSSFKHFNAASPLLNIGDSLFSLVPIPETRSVLMGHNLST
jgi:hypothetical protein